jgi:hypothetical protein
VPKLSAGTATENGSSRHHYAKISAPGACIIQIKLDLLKNMAPRDRVIAPRIVEPNGLRTAIWSLLFLLILAAAVVFGFELGRSWPLPDCQPCAQSLHQAPTALAQEPAVQAPAASDSPTVLDDAAPAPPTAESEATTESPDASTAQPSPTLDSTEENPTTAAANMAETIATNDLAKADMTGQLIIKDFALKTDKADKRFRYQFSVGHADATSSGLVTGSIWIAINGLLDGQPTRLPLRQVSDQDASFIRMRFKQLQIVSGNLMLPKGFAPKNIIIEAKPLDEQYRAALSTIPWDPMK